MDPWVAIGLIFAGLIGVAVVMLIFDVTRGDIGGRHTLARARRILVVATDGATADRAEEWVAAERIERPDLQCFVLIRPEGEQLYQGIHEVLDREAPDSIVFVRHRSERDEEHTGTLARLHDEGVGPIDSIYVHEGVTA
ncbi:MAG: hypothetical protein R2718_05775 [Solirubrobacterales bacterium]|nr:hypothetical protein [Solirubrobacterales bacterium]